MAGVVPPILTELSLYPSFLTTAGMVVSGKWHSVNRESEILRKKYKSESNTVNTIKLMILEKISVIIHTPAHHAQRVL
jgi:hypothetical protein